MCFFLLLLLLAFFVIFAEDHAWFVLEIREFATIPT